MGKEWLCDDYGVKNEFKINLKRLLWGMGIFFFRLFIWVNLKSYM